MKWQTPPEISRKTPDKIHILTDEELNELRGNLGAWALVRESASAHIVCILRKRHPEFEFTSRTVGTEITKKGNKKPTHDIYVRFVHKDSRLSDMTADPVGGFLSANDPTTPDE